MTGILDFLASSHPGLYSSTLYTTVEVSPRLAAVQRSASKRHSSHVSVLQKSALLLTEAEGYGEECFVIATEVLDNLSHDIVRYLPDSLEPLQASVSVDGTGDFSETFSASLDPLLSRCLALRSRLGRPHSRPRVLSAFEANARPWRLLKSNLPFAPNLSKPEFLPTRMLELLEVLRDRFPRHRLVISDFSSLPDAIHGANAPVVQTRYAGVVRPSLALQT